MRVGSLFSGIGGFDLGFERAGHEVVWQCEFDPHASRVLEAHWPNVKRYSDVRELNGREAPAVDILAGGFPCQDLSVAGRRAGMVEGTRSGLFYEFARLIEECQPRYVLIENVPGLLSSRGGRDMGAVLGSLVELGYGWAYRVLDAQYDGLAQRRKRVFIVGCLGDDGRRASEILFESESLRWDSAPSREAGKEVAGSLGGGSGARGWRNDLDRSGAFVVASPLTASAGHHGHSSPCGDGSDNLVIGLQQVTSVTNRSQPQPLAPTLNGAGRMAIFPIQDGREIEKHQNGIGLAGDGEPMYTLDGTGAQAVAVSGEGTQLVPSVTSKWAKGSGGPAGDECQNLVAYVPEITGALSGGAHPGGLSGQDAYTQAVPPLGCVRRLTPRECERLQGFPDDWTAGQADSHRYRQIGNAVAVPVAQWIAGRFGA